jgi:glycosyltransferase involved in cell wall biosynthesis
MINIVYDHFVSKGGAEKVCLMMSKILKNSLIHSAYVDMAKFAGDKINCHSSNYLNGLFPLFNIIFFYLFRFKVKKNSTIIANGVFSPLSLCFNKYQTAIIYFHTFPSFLNEEKFTSYFLKRNFYNALCAIYKFCLRKSCKSAHVVFCNSSSVKNRLKIIGVEAAVLYPPVEIDTFYNGKDLGYYLVISRLEPNKRIFPILDAFKMMPDRRLYIIGGGSLSKEVENISVDMPNVKLFGELGPEAIRGIIANSKAIINIPSNEYFGMTPVEAMAAGKFVIGANEGGMKETITDEILGTLLESPILGRDLVKAIESFELKPQKSSYSDYRMDSAKRFSSEKFELTLKEVIYEHR